MKYYTFHQNNSGGFFVGPSTIIVRARNAEEANAIAQEKAKVYFNGVGKGRDCPCCGNRWYPVYDDDGYDVPSMYGSPINEEELKSIPIYENLENNFQI